MCFSQYETPDEKKNLVQQVKSNKDAWLWLASLAMVFGLNMRTVDENRSSTSSSLKESVDDIESQVSSHRSHAKRVLTTIPKGYS